MTYYDPIEDCIDLYGATIFPMNWDEHGRPTNDCIVSAPIPQKSIEAKQVLQN